MTLQPLKVNDVVSVYEGEAGTCCCGCAGEYYYSPAFAKLIAEYVSEHLIRQKPEQFNQEKVSAITELVNNHIEEEPHGIRIVYGNDGVTYPLGVGFYALELDGLRYHVRTTAEYELVRRSKKQVAAKKASSPHARRR